MLFLLYLDSQNQFKQAKKKIILPFNFFTKPKFGLNACEHVSFGYITTI